MFCDHTPNNYCTTYIQFFHIWFEQHVSTLGPH
jgi:hypothetical protein